MKQFFLGIGRVLLLALGRLLVYLYDQAVDALSECYLKLTTDENADAAFGTETDIASRYEKGFLISQNRRLGREDSFKNVILYGQIGSGKTTRYIIPVTLRLLDQPCSIIINDPAHQCFSNTSGYAQKMGFRVLVLNWSAPEVSVGFNLLKACRDYSEVKRLADTLVRASNKDAKSDPFWTSHSRITISLFMQLVLLLDDPELHHMVNVSHLLGKFAGGKQNEVDLLVARAGLKPEGKKLYSDYLKLVAMPEKTRQNVLASVFAVLEIFDDPRIAQVVSAPDSLELNELRKTPTILYIQNSVGSQKYLDVLNSCFYELLYGHLLERLPEEDELDLFMIYEEFSSMYIPLIPSFLANNRKHRIGNFLCLQANSQLDHYGPDKLNISANCVTHIVLPGDHPTEFLREIEQKSGTITITDKEGRKEKKALVPMAGFRLWSTDTALIMQGNKAFVKAKTRAFYQSRELSRKTSLPPATIENSMAAPEPKMIGG